MSDKEEREAGVGEEDRWEPSKGRWRQLHACGGVCRACEGLFPPQGFIS